MSTETKEQPQDEMMGTKPVGEHAWLQKLVGEWNVSSEMMMPDGNTMTTEGKESVKSLGGLWAVGHATSSMNGEPVEMFNALGYDVSFKEYRGCWYMSMSSHLWKSVGTLSEDGKKMTLDCVGPDMEKDGETANYRDVIELIDDNTRTLTSFGEQPNGEWQQYMKATYRRA